MSLLSQIDYSVFPPINAVLNSIATVLLIVGFVLIKQRKQAAHQKVMIGALVASSLFLGCYLFYHYGTGHTEFPREYPVARRVYLAILIPHIILAVVNLPFIIALVVFAFRGTFARHMKVARFVYPSWLFVSVTGVIIYFMVYQWFPPKGGRETASTPSPSAETQVKVLEGEKRFGSLVYSPTVQEVKVTPGTTELTVRFEVENTGKEPVDVLQLRSTCTCLSVTIDQDPIPPGATATLTGVFDIEKLKGTSDRSLTVTTSEHARPVILTTRIDIPPIYTIEPPMTTWEIGSEPETKTVEFRVLRDEPIRILSAESKRKEVSCEFEAVEEGRVYLLKLTPDTTASNLLGIVRIETDCEIENHASPLAYFSVQ